MIPPRTWWTCKELLSACGLDGRERVESEEDAILISSLTTNGLHAPCLDLDFPCEVRGNQLRMVPGHTRKAWVDESVMVLRDLRLVESVDDDDDALVFTFGSQHPLRVFSSTNPKHSHLYIDSEMPWSQYERTIKAFNHCMLIGPRFAKNSIIRQMTMLIRPGLNKFDLADRGIYIHQSDEE